MTTQQTFEPGTLIFNAGGATAEVALDRRAKGGKLWGKSSYTRRDYRTNEEKEVRHELHGQWLAREGNEILAEFCIRTQRAAIIPLRTQVEELNHRIARIKYFANLTLIAVAGGVVSDEVIARFVLNIGYANMEQRREVRERLGEPPGEHYYAEYEVSIETIGGPVIVKGSKGNITIKPPAELKEAG